jgi:hypothetical protein
MCQPPTAGRVRPERQRQLLQDVAHPPHAKRLPALHAREGQLVAGHNSQPQVRPRNFDTDRTTAHRLSVWLTVSYRAPATGPAGIVLDDEDVAMPFNTRASSAARAFEIAAPWDSAPAV